MTSPFRRALLVFIAVIGMALAASTPAMAAPQVPLTVRVTLGANDPVVGAMVVARDARTGQALSNQARSGYLGVATVLVASQPGRRITVWAEGGRARVGAPDILRSTVRLERRRGDFVYINPVSTVASHFAEAHPSMALRAVSARVARGLRMPDPSIDDPARNTSYSAVWFSGKKFHRVARDRGGAHAHAARLAANIAARGRVTALRGTRAEARLPGAARTRARENAAPPPPDPPPSAGDIAGEVAEDGESMLVTGGKWLAGQAVSWAWDTYGPQLGLKYSVELDIANLRKQMLDQFQGIHDQISQLQAGINMTLVSQKRIEDALAKMRSDAALARFTTENNRVQAALSTLSVMAARTAQYYANHADPAAPDSPEAIAAAQDLKTFKANLAQLIRDDNCPDIDTLVGAIPSQATGGSSLCMGINRQGLVQLAQGDAANNAFISAADQITTIDATGRRWLAIGWQDVALHILAWKSAADSGTPVLTPETIDATGTHLVAGLTAVADDRTGAYFGVRIPRTQVVAVNGFSGTVYAIGTLSASGGAYTAEQPFVDDGEKSLGSSDFVRASAISPAAAPAIQRIALCEFLRPAVSASPEVAAARAGCATAPMPTSVPGPWGPRNPIRPTARLRASVPLPNLQVALDSGCSTFDISTGFSGNPPTPPPGKDQLNDGLWQPLASLRGYRCNVLDATAGTAGANCVITDGARDGAGVAMLWPVRDDQGNADRDRTQQQLFPVGPGEDWFAVGRAFPNLCPSAGDGPLSWSSYGYQVTPGPPRAGGVFARLTHTSFIPKQGTGFIYDKYLPANGCSATRIHQCITTLIGGPNWTPGNEKSGAYVVGALFQRGYAPNTYIPGTGP